MKPRMTLAAVAFSLALLFAGCGGEPPTTATQDTLATLAPDADGATIYQARCASCHGEDLRGTDKGPSQLSIVYEPNHHGDDSYRSAITNGAPQHHWGFGDMPAVEDMGEDQIERVIVYIRAQQQALGFEQ